MRIHCEIRSRPKTNTKDKHKSTEPEEASNDDSELEASNSDESSLEEEDKDESQALKRKR